MNKSFLFFPNLCRQLAGTWAGLTLALAAGGAAQAQVAVDGRIYSTEVAAGASGYYSSMGQYTRPHTSASGFGDYGLLQAYVSNTSSKLTIGVRGSLETNTMGATLGNVIQVYLDLPNRSGVAAGATLPYTASGTTAFEGMAGTRLDMPADYGLALGYNSAGAMTAQYADYTQGGYATAGNLGTLSAGGLASTFYSSVAGGRFYGTRMAYVAPAPNALSYNNGQGWEMELDLASLGVQPGQQVRVFVAYASGDSGYMSTDFIPESGTSINPGVQTNFGNYAGVQAFAYTLVGGTGGTTSYCTTNLGGGSCDIYSVQLPGASSATTASTCSGTAGNYYSSYQSGIALQPGRSYNLGVTSTIGASSISAWADWNRDGQFSSGEYVQLASTTTAYSPATATITVPSGAAQGSTVLRIRTRASGNPNTATDACTTFGSGETRDYAIAVGCALATPTVSGDGAYCVGQVVYLSASGIPGGASYYWTGPNNFLSYSAAPAFYATATNAGAYVLNVASGSCATASRAVQVGVTAAPTAPAAAGGSNCGPGSVTLTASGAPSGSTYRWYTSSGSASPVATGGSYTTPYLANSTYYYVSVANAAGCESGRSYALAAINAAPAVTLFAGGATTFCQGSSVSLSSSSSGTAAVSYQHNRNGNAIGGATGSTYAATQSGSYTVTVINASGCTGTSNAVVVSVNPGTSAAFAYATNTYCQSGANPAPAVTGTAGGSFTASGSGLNLNPFNGTVNLAQSQPGTYVVTYSLTGTCGSSSSTNLTITQAARAAFSYPSASYCATNATTLPTLGAGSSAGTFSATPAGLGLNASTGAVDLAASQPGTYIITNAIAAGSGCTPTAASAQLVVNAVPTAGLTAGGPLVFCQGGTVLLTAPAGPGYAYQFLRNGAAIAGATGASYSATTAGNYAATVTNATGCSATTPVATAVVVNPATSAAFAYGAASYCQSGALNPAPTVSGTPGGSFGSTTGLSLNAATGTIDLAQSQPGTYTVTYSVAGTCPSTGTASVVVTAPASASFAFAAPSFCAGAAATASVALASGASAGTFSATPAGLGLNAGTGAVDLAASQPGTYTITNAVAAASGCAATTGTTVLIVNAAPVAPTVAVVRSGSTTTLSSSAPTGNQWYLNGTPIAGATADTYTANTAAQTGTYTVTTTNANGCASPASAPTIVTGTVRPLAGSTLTLYPNPTPDGRFTLELTGYFQAVDVDVLDVLGQEVLQLRGLTGTAGTLRQAISLPGQASGVYLLRTRSAGHTDIRRLVLK